MGTERPITPKYILATCTDIHLKFAPNGKEPEPTYTDTELF